jgi:hypothetical protein
MLARCTVNLGCRIFRQITLDAETAMGERKRRHEQQQQALQAKQDAETKQQNEPPPKATAKPQAVERKPKPGG